MSVERKHFWQVVRRLCGGFSCPRKYGLSGCMPAVVSSTDGSYVAGTSELEGSRLWSRATKKSRKVRRISSEVTVLSLGRARDRAVTDDQVAVHEHGGLAGGGAEHRIAQLELEPGVAAGRRVAGESG